ncbi:MAG: hypothetical protein GY950_22665 [bacterium]|nr:hypothetical protein [bacterium]
MVDILGVIEEEIFITLTKNILTQNRKEIIEQVNNLAERGMDLRFFYGEYLKFLRDLMVLKSLEASDKLHNLNPENIPTLKEILKNVRDIELLRYFNAAKDLEITIRNTENPRIILEYLFLKLSYFPSLVSIEELIDEVKSGRRSAPPVSPAARDARDARPPRDIRGTGTEASPQPSQPSQPLMSTLDGPEPPAPAAVPTAPGQLKPLLVEKVHAESPRWASALGAASFALENNKLVITLTSQFEPAFNKMKEQPEILKKMARDILKRNIDLEIVIDKTGVNEEKATRENLENDEKVNNLMDKIKGKLVSIE